MEKLDLKRIKNSNGFKTAVAGAVLFVSAVLFSPVSGICRTIPFFVVAGVLVRVLKASDLMGVLMGAAMTLCTYLVCGRSVFESLLFCVASSLLTSSGIYIARLAEIMKATEKKGVKKKCSAYISASVLISLVLSLVLCGNAVSFVLNDYENTSYISEKYGDKVEKRYSCYEFSKGEYCTYVSFKDGKEVYGNSDECYVSSGRSLINDDVRNHFEEKMLYSANGALSEIIVGATWGFNVIASDIVFDEGEVLPWDTNAADYLDRISYVVSFDSIIGENEKDKFADICAQTVSEISKSGFEFKNIMFCAGNAADVLFCAKVTPETEAGGVSQLVKAFDEKHLEDFGVSEQDILDYWKNK